MAIIQIASNTTIRISDNLYFRQFKIKSAYHNIIIPRLHRRSPPHHMTG
ncbi:MAG: hypothetical protein KME32_31755 [Mojavia pulchra JT2-VF2]|uniref:Uncharacterized protein n=1 Tax=Mojavia pulchra JT2-VF2 TaxID=287848 RepID=A0A951UJS3_9NOST|nr:hypothetical protein [Mojavia pulchra JT2-VF2]